MKNNHIVTFYLLFALSSCTTLKPENFSSTLPVLDPVKFFSGGTHSSGVLEARNGKPSERITTKTTGEYSNGVLNIEQDLYPEKGNHKHRNFKLKLIDEHHVESTGSDIVGLVRGELYGNYFTWNYRLKIADKGLVQHVHMTQYMMLMPDGKTLVVRSVVRKFGIIVKEITEQFHKDE